MKHASSPDPDPGHSESRPPPLLAVGPVALLALVFGILVSCSTDE